MSMKCRCGSDDGLEMINGIIVRISDGKQHLCEYHTGYKNSIFNQKKLDEIDEQLDKLVTLEDMITKKLTIDNVTPNPAKVGMYMKFIWDKMVQNNSLFPLPHFTHISE